jgi:hypothetical protein
MTNPQQENFEDSILLESDLKSFYTGNRSCNIEDVPYENSLADLFIDSHDESRDNLYILVNAIMSRLTEEEKEIARLKYIYSLPVVKIFEIMKYKSMNHFYRKLKKIEEKLFIL